MTVHRFHRLSLPAQPHALLERGTYLLYQHRADHILLLFRLVAFSAERHSAKDTKTLPQSCVPEWVSQLKPYQNELETSSLWLTTETCCADLD